MDALTIKIQVLLIEDQPLIRAGLTAILSDAGDINVATAASGAAEAAEALEQVESWRPHVAIVGTSCARSERIALVRALAGASPTTRVLALPRAGEGTDTTAYLEAGAAGVLDPMASPELLVYSVRGAADGLADADPLPRSDPDGLSMRESEVARLIVRGYGNKDIAAQLQLSVKTVETYKARLMQKLGVSSRAALVDRGLRRGWLAHYQ